MRPLTWTPAGIPDQHGLVAVVTGANGGLGWQTARTLASKGAHVVIAARNQGKAQQAARHIAGEVSGAKLEIRQLDLASLASVRECGDGIVADHGQIDLLINNAGVMGIPEQRSAEGLELQLSINHLGHFVLTRRLMPALATAPSARVVSVTSMMRLVGRTVNSADARLQGRYDPWRAYGQAKLANLQFALELHRRLESARVSVKSLAAHPGLTYTDLHARSVRETRGGLSQALAHLAARHAGTSAQQGAWPTLRAATDPDARGGQLWAPRWGTLGAPAPRPLFGRALSRRATRWLWEFSEQETQERFDVDALVSQTG